MPDREGGVEQAEEVQDDPRRDGDHGQDFRLGDVVAVKEDYEQKLRHLKLVPFLNLLMKTW